MTSRVALGLPLPRLFHASIAQLDRAQRCQAPPLPPSIERDGVPDPAARAPNAHAHWSESSHRPLEPERNPSSSAVRLQSGRVSLATKCVCFVRPPAESPPSSEFPVAKKCVAVRFQCEFLFNGALSKRCRRRVFEEFQTIHSCLSSRYLYTLNIR